ncbi:carbohydrate ABC transporter permease [Brachybacterium sp. JB7]|uniref:ABC transporter permease n=2 Tax=Dermabacteraceae TaxID=85020 RepID=A0A2A3YG08_9MICO|nr:ABC transporter permease [Brachybacterium alimentarium]RCS64035.1 carbohydrate ABC transporter permease [Brachybacterium sp. JB7]PCC38263.1 ABC transporter permease [Brachybacterium alimentarium]RCS71919.1 carbohydrate ABC transporter permease [Brachybacterium alimentarium]RCS74279.1 carbohydrate ABC transporter permease [Brachybacterium alimentarium]
MTAMSTATHSAPVLTATPRRRRPRRSWIHTVIGIVLVAIMLFPVYWMLNASLAPAGNSLNTQWLPLDPDFSGYSRAIADQGQNLVTSVIVAVGACLLSIVIAAPCAYALAQFRIKGTAALLFLVLISQMIPGIVIANALYTVYTPLGLINSIPGLILADASQGIPFAILIMRAYLETFPTSIVEAARVDGCGHVRAFWSIVLPVSKNSLITAGIFSFLFAWSDFLMALTLTTGETIRPVTLGLYTYIGTNDTDWSAVMSTAVLSSLPAVILMIVAQKYVAAGATGGAVK